MRKATGITDKNGKEIFTGDTVVMVVPDKDYVERGNGWDDVNTIEGFEEKGKVKFLHNMWFLDTTGDGKGLPLEFEEDQILEVVEGESK